MADDAQRAHDTLPFSQEEIAELYAIKGYPEKALPLLRRILEAQPHRVDLRDRIAALEHAVFTHQRRAKTREIHPEVMAEAYELMELPGKAIETLEELLRLRPDDRRLQKWLARLQAAAERAAPE